MRIKGVKERRKKRKNQAALLKNIFTEIGFLLLEVLELLSSLPASSITDTTDLERDSEEHHDQITRKVTP